MNDDALLEVSPPQGQGFAPLGEVLSAARKAKKLSEQDVSNNLRLSLKQISDIENNDFSTLPQPMITRGFIRNYARFLEIDAEPLLDSYRARVPDKTPKSVSVQSSMYQVVSGKESQPWLRYILGSILILLFLLAWIFYIDYMPKPAKTPAEKTTDVVPTTSATSSTTELTLPEVALPAAERQSAPDDVVAGTDSATANNSSGNATANNTITSSVTLPAESANATSPNAAVANVTSSNTTSSNTVNSNTAQSAKPVENNKTSQTAASNALQPSPASSSATNPQAAPAASPVSTNTATNAVPTSSQKVSISIIEKTWIQATDKSGKVIYERILPAGSTDGFDGQPPINVVIGNAKGTKLSFLGKPIDLASSTTQNNVARIKLE